MFIAFKLFSSDSYVFVPICRIPKLIFVDERTFILLLHSLPLAPSAKMTLQYVIIKTPVFYSSETLNPLKFCEIGISLYKNCGVLHHIILQTFLVNI